MQDPYRPLPPAQGQDPELARLAAYGQQRLAANAHASRAEMQVQGGANLATAVGAYRGSPIRKLCWVMLLGGLGLASAGLLGIGLGYATGGIMPIGGILAFITIFIFSFAPPSASQAGIREEWGWATSRGFAFVGYFETLSSTPVPVANLVFDIDFADPMRVPDPGLVTNVFGGLDPQGMIQPWAGGIRFTSGMISGRTGIRVNGVPIYRNHEYAKYVHRIVDGGLSVLHRTYPLASVTLSR